ncbi:MAG: phosphotransferase, partial [Anaerolineae bacterium]|nr:phosphotransferase [Anaerolineae bacterium]
IRAAREHPLAAKVFAGDRGRQFQALLDDLGQLLDALERLPLTFAHADLNTGNMVAPQGSDEQTVLLDWQFGGSQVIGYDVSTVVGCCAVYEGPVYGQANEVTGPTINAYLEGIRRSGWPGDERLVRFGCLGAVTVRVTLVIPDLVLRAIQHIRDPERLATRMNYLSESLAYLLTLTKETRELASLGV